MASCWPPAPPPPPATCDKHLLSIPGACESADHSLVHPYRLIVWEGGLRSPGQRPQLTGTMFVVDRQPLVVSLLHVAAAVGLQSLHLFAAGRQIHDCRRTTGINGPATCEDIIDCDANISHTPRVGGRGWPAGPIELLHRFAGGRPLNWDKEEDSDTMNQLQIERSLICKSNDGCKFLCPEGAPRESFIVSR